MSYPIRTEWFDRPGWSGFHTPRPGNSDGLHHGFDYYCPEGTPIYATGDGVVKGRGTGFGPTSFGNNTTIWYNGTPIVAATYAHMNALPLNPVGTRVTANTILGYVGHTGNAATVIWNGLRHVHEEIVINGRYVDPIAHNGVSTAGGNSTPITTPPAAVVPITEDRDMQLVFDKNAPQNVYLVAPGHDLILVGGEDVATLRNLLQGGPDAQGYTFAQLQRIKAFMLAIA